MSESGEISVDASAVASLEARAAENQAQAKGTADALQATAEAET